MHSNDLGCMLDLKAAIVQAMLIDERLQAILVARANHGDVGHCFDCCEGTDKCFIGPGFGAHSVQCNGDVVPRPDARASAHNNFFAEFIIVFCHRIKHDENWGWWLCNRKSVLMQTLIKTSGQ